MMAAKKKTASQKIKEIVEKIESAAPGLYTYKQKQSFAAKVRRSLEDDGFDLEVIDTRVVDQEIKRQLPDDGGPKSFTRRSRRV